MTEDLKNLAFEMHRRGIPPRYFAAQIRRGVPPQEIIAAWPVRPLSSRVGSRRFRRRLVVGIYTSWVVVALIAKLTSMTSSGWIISGFSVLGVVVAANLIISAVWLNRRTYINAPALADDELDERLVQVRNRAFHQAYRVLIPVALVAWLLSLVVIRIEPGAQGWNDAFLIYAGVVMLAATLPTAIVAWGEPDPAEPEQPPT